MVKKSGIKRCLIYKVDLEISLDKVARKITKELSKKDGILFSKKD